MKMQFNHDRSVVDFLRENTQARPDSLAVQDVDHTLTYGELDQKSDLVALDLSQRGLHLEETVAILLPASGNYVVAMLGILKAGGAYLPLDPSAPPQAA